MISDVFVIRWRNYIIFTARTAIFIAVAAVTVGAVHVGIIDVKQTAILHGSSLVLGFFLAVVVIGSIWDHHIFRGKSAEIKKV